MTSEDTVEGPFLQIFLKSNVFLLRVTVHLLFSLLLQETLESVFLPPYDCLKLKHDKKILHTEQEFFTFRVTVHLLFSFSLKKTLKSVFLPRYEPLKLNHDTNYLMTSEDTVVEDPLMCVHFYIKSKVFDFLLQSIYRIFILEMK